MEKKMILLLGVVFILASALVVALTGFTFTGRVVGNIEENYNYTKAICNSNNECIDVLVECENGEVKSLKPVSDVVKFGKDWKDFRDKENYC